MATKKKAPAGDLPFEIGAKIVHPAHGAGVIAAIEQNDVVDEFSRYYVIELAANEMRLLVPVRTALDIGLRPVAGNERSQELLEILGSTPTSLPDDFKKRQAFLAERLKEGRSEQLATVVRDMAFRNQEKSYSPTEARLFDQARSMLGGELALAQGIEVDEALAQIAELTKGNNGGADEATEEA